MGSRGLGEARGAPPPLRGAQRDMGRDRCVVVVEEVGPEAVEMGSGGGRRGGRAGEKWAGVGGWGGRTCLLRALVI